MNTSLSKKLSVAAVVAVVLGVVAAVLTYPEMCEGPRGRKMSLARKGWQKWVVEPADEKAKVQLRDFFKLVGDGYPEDSKKPAIAELVREMTKTSKWCSPAMEEDLFARRLDGAFLVGDYAECERMMDQFTDKSESWRKGAKAKIRAHAALDAGDKATAIKEFQEFVDIILVTDEDVDEIDPYTGTEWTREMIVARNYKRLAQLSEEIGRADGAAAYRAKAAEMFKTAYEMALENPDMKATIEKEAGDLLQR